MAHELSRLVKRLSNNPQLIDLGTFEDIFSYLEDRNVGNIELADQSKQLNINSEEVSYNQDTGVGWIDVSGPLTKLQYQPMCGSAPTSYQSIEAQFDVLVAAGAKTIVLGIDSPGGEASGVFELGRYMRKHADTNQIKLIAYVDDLAASAGYALASSAHEIILNPSAEAGSIGVVIKLRNTNKQKKMEGVEESFVYAGDNKIPFDANGDFTKEFIDDLQLKVDVLYQEFTSYVSQMRGIDVNTVKNTEAKTFLAGDVIALGLADQQMNREDFFTYLSDIVQGNTMLKSKLFGGQKQMSSVLEQENLMNLEEIKASLEAKVSELEASQVALVAVKEELTLALASKEELSVEFSSLKEQLSEFQAWKEEKLQQEAVAKIDARKGLIASLVQEDQREALFTSTTALDDVSFDIVVGALKAKSAAEKESLAFKELGVSDEGEGVEETDGTTRLINKKYKN